MRAPAPVRADARTCAVQPYSYHMVLSLSPPVDQARPANQQCAATIVNRARHRTRRKHSFSIHCVPFMHAFTSVLTQLHPVTRPVLVCALLFATIATEVMLGVTRSQLFTASRPTSVAHSRNSVSNCMSCPRESGELAELFAAAVRCGAGGVLYACLF